MKPPVFLALEHAALRQGDAVVFAGTHWTWRAGEQWAILGPDGSGAPLLIEALMGRVPLAHGEVHGPHRCPGFSGAAGPEAFAHISPHVQRRLALEESTFYQSRWHSGLAEGQRTVAQFLSQSSVEEHNPFEVGRPPGDVRSYRQRQRQFLRWLGIQALQPRKLVQLSNGELRKTLLVHALLKAPRLLILEDPFAGLDAATRRVLHRVIDRLIRRGTPVLVSTHRAEDIPTGTSHVLLIDGHRVVAQGPKREVLRRWRQRPLGASPPFRTAADKPSTAAADPTRPTPRKPLIELRGINVIHGRRRILRDVTWTVREGECWTLRGPNGAGKTTLLNLIQGDHPQAHAQDVRLFGRVLDSTQALWRVRQQLGWMSPELHQHFPGEWEALEVVCSGYFGTIGLYESCSRARRRTARQSLLDLGLAAQARMPFGELTFGQQRLVLFARAAVKRPRLLILDEPCQGLDTQQRHTLLAAVDATVARTGCGLIFVTHRAGEIPRCVTHELCLAAGRVRAARALGITAGATRANASSVE